VELISEKNAIGKVGITMMPSERNSEIDEVTCGGLSKTGKTMMTHEEFIDAVQQTYNNALKCISAYESDKNDEALAAEKEEMRRHDPGIVTLSEEAEASYIENARKFIDYAAMLLSREVTP
jgi:hypothetical protein